MLPVLVGERVANSLNKSVQLHGFTYLFLVCQSAVCILQDTG